MCFQCEFCVFAALISDQLAEFINKPISFLNKWWRMGNVRHLRFSLLATVAPTCFRTASLDDTPGEQMCSNEFILNSDVREGFFHYFPVILLSMHSSEVERDIQGPGDKTQLFRSVETKIAVLWHLDSFSVTQSSLSSYMFTFFCCFYTSEMCKVQMWQSG